MARLLYVHSRRNTFIKIDRDALAERFEVVDYYQPSLRPSPIALWRGMRSCDVVFGWFASWHTFFALTLAWILRKPSVLVFGGFDTAAMPEIGYGSQRGGIRRLMVRWTISRATRLITNSHYSLGEIERNLGIDPARVAVVYHGIPDRFGELDPEAERQRMALTVGAVYSVNVERKGHGPFLEAAGRLPDVEFVLVGGWSDETGERLAAEVAPNARLTGHLSDHDLDNYFRGAAVYVQASLHEGFGLSLAEAMLAGAIPVVTRAGALPEVVGDAGIYIDQPTPEAIAGAIGQALGMDREANLAARARIRDTFTFELRRDGICAQVDGALSA